MKSTKSRLSRKSPVASRQSKTKQVSSVSRAIPHIVPSRIRTTLTFYDYYLLNTGAASLLSSSFRANSCRDPQAAAGGGAPSGFTQLSYVYLRYRVLSVRAEVWGYNTCISPITIGIFFRSANGAVVTTGPEAQQFLMERSDLCHTVTTTPSGSGYGYATFKVSSSRTISKIEGRDTSGAEYSTTFLTEPATQCYVDIVLVSSDGSAINATANAHIRLTYTLEAFEPNQEYTD